MFADSSRLLNGLLNLLLQSVPFPWKSELKSFANPYIINVFQVFQEPDQLKWYPKWVSKFFLARFQRNRISSNPFIAKLIVQCDQQVETPPLWNSERPLFSRSLWVFALDLFVEKKKAKQFKKKKKIIPTYHDAVLVESLVWVKLLRYTVLVCIENLTREKIASLHRDLCDR